ncbi:hypothetical protein ACFLUX_03010 [Chloroflexota bacterium]
MSGKSQHGRGKSSLRSKKRRNIQRSHQVEVARPQTVVRSDEPTVDIPEVKTPPSVIAATVPAGFNYPSLTYELRIIGILTGIILATLVLLALLLS